MRTFCFILNNNRRTDLIHTAPVSYTHLDVYKRQVPDVLLSGDPKKVDAWRLEQSLKRTAERRPDMMDDDK